MTNDNASRANETDVPNLRPISDHENSKVRGTALCCKQVHENHLSEVAELRGKQQEYLESLPTDPIEAMSLINKTLGEIDDISGQEYAVKAALEIVHQLSTTEALDDNPKLNKAIFWLVDQALDGFDSIEKSQRLCRDIAGRFNPNTEAYKA